MSIIYIDESGAFDQYQKKRNVIGGIWCKMPVPHNEVKQLFSQCGLSKVHACELDNETLSLLVQKLIPFCEGHSIKPVILLPRRGFFIISDTATYINVLSDGLVEFIKTYAKELDATIEIIIEHRKGFKVDVDTKRLHEAIAKGVALSKVQNNINYTITFRGKDNIFLQLADVVVHSFYRLDHDGSFLKGEVKEAFKEWMEPNTVYIYGNESYVTRIYDCLRKGDYGEALQLYANHYMIPEVRQQKDFIIKNILKLSQPTMAVVLKNILTLYYDKVNTNRLLNEYEPLVKLWIYTILPDIEKAIADGNNTSTAVDDLYWAYGELYQILLTIYNHKGQIADFETTYNEARILLKKAVYDLDSLSVRIRIQVLNAVHYINQYQFEQAYTSMKVLAKRVEDAFVFLSEADNDVKVKPRILGEIYGTMVQACMYHTLVTKNNFNEARELSNKALHLFSHTDDIQRQYQYRAQIETYDGNYEQAMQYIAKGVGCTTYSDDDLIAQCLKNKSMFGLQHLLRIWYCKLMNGYENTYYTVLSNINKPGSTIAKNYKEIMEHKVYPVHSIYRCVIVIYGLLQSKHWEEHINKLLPRAKELFDGQPLTMQTLQLGLLADVLWIFAHHDAENKEIMDRFNKRFNDVMHEASKYASGDYLQKAYQHYQQTPVKKWNTLWWVFPF